MDKQTDNTINEADRIRIDVAYKTYSSNEKEFNQYYYYIIFGIVTSYFFIYKELLTIDSKYIYIKVLFSCSIVFTLLALLFWLLGCYYGKKAAACKYTICLKKIEKTDKIGKEVAEQEKVAELNEKQTRFIKKTKKMDRYSYILLFLSIVIYTILLIINLFI